MDPLVPFNPTVEVVTTPTGFVQPAGLTFLPEHPYKLIRQGRFQNVPMLTGINKDEGLLYHAESKIKLRVSHLKLCPPWAISHLC